MKVSKAILLAVVACLVMQAQVSEATFLLGFQFWHELLFGKPVTTTAVARPVVVTTAPPPTVPSPPRPMLRSPSPSPSPSARPSGAQFPNVAAAAIATPELSTLVQVASAVGLADVLADPNLVATVLAPNNAAFAKLLAATGLTTDQLLANQDLVRLILSYHLIPGQAVKAAQLTNGQTLTTGDQGETLTVRKSGSSVSFDPTGPNAPNANVVQADITAGAAVVHIIDEVLIPANANLSLQPRAARANATAGAGTTGATTTTGTAATGTTTAGTTTAGTTGAGATTAGGTTGAGVGTTTGGGASVQGIGAGTGAGVGGAGGAGGVGGAGGDGTAGAGK